MCVSLACRNPCNAILQHAEKNGRGTPVLRRICDPIRIIAGNEIGNRAPPIFCGLPPLTETLSPLSPLSRDAMHHVNSHATISTDYRNNGARSRARDSSLVVRAHGLRARAKNLSYLSSGKREKLGKLRSSLAWIRWTAAKYFDDRARPTGHRPSRLEKQPCAREYVLSPATFQSQ